MKNKLALRASLTGSVFLDDVRVSNDSLLPKVKGLGGPFACLNSARSKRANQHLTQANIYILLDLASLGEPWVPWRTALTGPARTPLRDTNSNDQLLHFNLCRRNWSMPMSRLVWVCWRVYRQDYSSNLFLTDSEPPNRKERREFAILTRLLTGWTTQR